MTEQTPTHAPEELRTLLLIDGANFLYRAHHALEGFGKSFNAPDGRPVGAFMTFATMIKKAKDLSDADAIAIIFESTTKTFRDEIFPEYKATRKPTPGEIKIQMDLVRDIFPLMGVPVLWADGYEADDLLCSYGSNPADGWRVVMGSSDKDLAQSIGPRTVQLDPNGWGVRDEAKVLEKFKVGPAMIAQFLALQGDSVDNIPGVDRCGPGTSAKLLNKYGSIEGIFANVEAQSPALRVGLEEARDRIEGLLKLTTAVTSLPLPMMPDEILSANHNPDWASALAALMPLGTRKLIERAQLGVEAQEAKKLRMMAAKP